MNANPLISVIIPTYNRGRYIRETIDSVLVQTYGDYEIIVIDDGSTDNTRELVQIYGESVRYFYQKNQGVATARNFAASRARGKYLALLDSDDVWLPEKLEQQVQYFETHPEFVFVSGEVFIIDDNSQLIRHAKLNPDTVPTFENLFEFPFVHLSTVVIRKDIFEKEGRFALNIPGTEDYDLWLRLAKKYPFGLMRIPLAKYREHQMSMSVDIDRRLKSNLTAFSKPEITDGLNAIEKGITIGKVYYKHAQLYAERNQFRKAAKCYLKAIGHDPLIGRYYWPEEAMRMRYSLPYRIMKVYFLVMECLFWGIKNAIARHK